MTLPEPKWRGLSTRSIDERQVRISSEVTSCAVHGVNSKFSNVQAGAGGSTMDGGCGFGRLANALAHDLLSSAGYESFDF
jgi:hypothetical protein